MRYPYFSSIAWAFLCLGTGCHPESPAPATPLWVTQRTDQHYTGSMKVRFTTAQNGWIAGTFYNAFAGAGPGVVSMLLRTTTGGASWVSEDVSSLNLTGLRDICPVTDQVLYSYGADRTAPTGGQLFYVCKSQDAGKTWHKLASTGFINGRLTFLTEQVGVSASANAIIKTTDGGSSWQRVWSGGLVGLQHIRFATATTGYAVGGLAYDKVNGGVLLKTTNQGASWHDLPWTQGAIQEACFLSENVGFVVSLATDGSRRTVLHKTVDGGASWQAVGGQAPEGEYAFLSEQEFYCAGKSIYHTTNAGLSWQTEYTIPANTENDTFESMQFPAPSTGYAVSHQGLIVKRL
jgi:photosystem II stability/assembly factor-like uncharacterized protein